MDGKSVRERARQICNQVDVATGAAKGVRRALAGVVVAAAASLGTGCVYAGPPAEEETVPDQSDAIDCSLPENQGHEACGGGAPPEDDPEPDPEGPGTVTTLYSAPMS